MQTSLKLKNIVIVGGFNPPTFDKYFFIKNGILKEEDILPNSIFESLGVQILSEKLQISITINQIVVSSLLSNIEELTLSIIKIGNISNIIAVGFNFNWFLEDKTKGLEELSRNHFYNDKVEIFSKHFDFPDSVFGVYASKNFKGARLKMDIKPSKVQELNHLQQPKNSEFKDVINLIFNFHFDIKNNDITQMINYIEDYKSYILEAESIISLYQK